MRKIASFFIVISLLLFLFHDFYIDQDCQEYKEKQNCQLSKKCSIDKDGCLEHSAFHCFIAVFKTNILPAQEIHKSYLFIVKLSEKSLYINYIYKPPIKLS